MNKKKALRKKIREKRVKKERKLRKVVMKQAMNKVGKKMMSETPKKDFMTFLYVAWYFIKVLFGKFCCLIGMHNWKLCSGLPGQPKYTCFRCWAKSRALWGEGDQ